MSKGEVETGKTFAVFWMLERKGEEENVWFFKESNQKSRG